MENAKGAKDTNISKVAGKKLAINEADVRRELNIKDAPHHFFKKFKNDELMEIVEKIVFDTKWKTLDKKHLPPHWRYLFHILAHFLSDLIGGFDMLRADWVRVMAFLINKVQFTYSRFVFICMHANASTDNSYCCIQDLCNF